MSQNLQGLLFTVIFLVIFLLLYWTPTVIAAVRHVQAIGQVIVVNLFLGWTGIGWIIALVMAFRHVPKPTQEYGQGGDAK